MSELRACADIIRYGNNLLEACEMLGDAYPKQSERLLKAGRAFAGQAWEVFREISAETADTMGLSESAFLQAARIYADSLQSGNKYLNIDDARFSVEPAELVAVFRDNDIQDFTISDTDADIFKLCSEFIKLGCTLMGMHEVYRNSRDLGEVANKRGMAFEFSVD